MYRLIFFQVKLWTFFFTFLDLVNIQVKDIFAGAYANFATTHRVSVGAISF